MGYQIENLNIHKKFDNVKLFDKHKNMFVTNNNCKSSEIIKLAFFISKLIHKKLKIKPKAECRLVGFPDEILNELT